jgi:hypothetical protein
MSEPTYCSMCGTQMMFNPLGTSDLCLDCFDIEDGRADEPEEGDYITTDHVKFYQFGKLAFEVPDGCKWEDATRFHMEKEQFWTNIWFLSDHGNFHLIQMELPTNHD